MIERSQRMKAARIATTGRLLTVESLAVERDFGENKFLPQTCDVFFEFARRESVFELLLIMSKLRTDQSNSQFCALSKNLWLVQTCAENLRIDQALGDFETGSAAQFIRSDREMTLFAMSFIVLP